MSRKRSKKSKAEPLRAPVQHEAAEGFVLSPTLDLLCVGGLSILVFIPLLLSGRKDLLFIGAGLQAWFATAINMPHFMASYRLVYRSRASIMKHKWASMYVPAILLAYLAAALWLSQTTPVPAIVLVAVASAYLAWHYTGQVWGMMASYAYLAGQKFEPAERFLVRSSLRIMLVWHVTWFLYTQLRDRELVRPLYVLISSGTIVAFVLGGIGLALMYRRTGRLPPLRALVAWLAIFVWYAVLARDPRAIFWVQIAHAIQYLAFPIRVELNRTSQSAPSPRRVAVHMALYAAGLLIVSYVMGQVVPGTAMSVVADIFGEEPGKVAPVLILMFINIHHYFTDGVIWKISNPEVRKELFAHVRRETPVPGARRTIPAATPTYPAPQGEGVRR